jgi:hypothetical protein
MPGGGKRQKELLRKKRLDEKRQRIASRSETSRADRAAAATAGGPRCEFCGGPLIPPEQESPGPELRYGGHPICPTCYESVPRSDTETE